jgi:hypothetical protein
VISNQLRPKIRQFIARGAETSYRIDPRLAYWVAWVFPIPLAVPSSFILPLAGSLTIPRVFLMVAAMAALRETWKKVTTGGYVPMASDFAVPLMSLWMLVTLGINEGVKGLTGFGAVTAIEFACAYAVGRVFFGSPAGYEQLIRALRILVALVLFTALLDTLSGQNLTARIGWMLSGTPPAETFPKRFGLVRAQGALEHPILLGVFFVICAILFYHSNMTPKAKLAWIGVCVFGTLLPLSSAPLLSLIMAFATIGLLKGLQRFPWAVLLLVATFAFCVSTFFILVDDGLTVLIQNLTYDPQTGMFRVLIWQWAALNISRAPWIGIAFADWLRSEEMPMSMDSLYLVTAVRFGIPALCLLALSMLSSGVTMPLRPLPHYPHPRIPIIKSGMAIAIFILAFNSFTVHLWGSTWVLLAMIIGIRAGASESLFLSGFARAEIPPKPDERYGSRPLQRHLQRMPAR